MVRGPYRFSCSKTSLLRERPRRYVRSLGMNACLLESAYSKVSEIIKNQALASKFIDH